MSIIEKFKNYSLLQVTKENENLREVNRQEVDKLKENLALLEAQLHNLPDTPYGRSTSNQEIE